MEGAAQESATTRPPAARASLAPPGRTYHALLISFSVLVLLGNIPLTGTLDLCFAAVWLPVASYIPLHLLNACASGAYHRRPLTGSRRHWLLGPTIIIATIVMVYFCIPFRLAFVVSLPWLNKATESRWYVRTPARIGVFHIDDYDFDDVATYLISNNDLFFERGMLARVYPGVKKTPEHAKYCIVPGWYYCRYFD